MKPPAKTTRALLGALACSAALSCSGGGGDALGPEDVTGLRFVLQPTSASAGQGFTVTVELVAGNRRVTAATDVVTLAAAGVTLGGTTSAAAVNGVATFSDLVITRTNANLQLTATARSFSMTSSAFPIAAGAPSAQQSTVLLEPATLTPNGQANAVFTFKDAYDNPVSGLAVALSSNLSGLTFTPSSGTTSAAGEFTTTVSATGPGSAMVSASIGGISISFQSQIIITLPATALRFVTQPNSAVAGQSFSASVEFIDANNQRVSGAAGQVSLSLTDGGTLAGSLTATAVGGVASFTNLSTTTAAAAARLVATGGGFTVNGTPFLVIAAAVNLAQSSLTLAPALASGIASTATFTFRDQFSNAITGAAVSLASSLAATVFTPGTGTTTSAGVFTSAVTTATAGTGTFTATVQGVAVAFPVVAVAGVQCTIQALTLGTPAAVNIVLNNGCVFNGHPASIYRFTTPPGNATVVSVTATGNAGVFPELAITPDPPSANTLFFGNATLLATNGPREWLLPPGTFQLHVGSASGTSGTGTLTASSTGVGAAGCTNRVIVNVNGTYTGQSLASTDCVDQSGPYYFDVFSVFDGRPCTITMTAAFDAYLEVRDGANTLFAADDNSGGGTNARITMPGCNLGAAGPARIWASSFDALISGAYTLTIAYTGGAIVQLNGDLSTDPGQLRQIPPRRPPPPQ